MAPTAAQQLDYQVKIREKYFTRLQLAYDLIKKPEKVSIFYARCDNLLDTFEQFGKVSDNIELLNTQLDNTQTPVNTVAENKSFDEMYFEVKAHLAKLKNDAAEAAASAVTENAGSSGTTNPPTSFRLKLPTISVPVFSGDLVEFPSWKSLYDEIVHTCEQLSDIQKFSYLKQYLQGPALATIQNVSFCAANYPLAYRTLTERFSQKRIIAATHLNKILQFQPLMKDTVSSLSSYLDEFCTTVESLRGLNIPDFREFVLVHHCLRALDPKTRMEFETEMADTAFPSYANLIKFVKAKRSALEVYSVESSFASTSKPINYNKPPFNQSNHHRMLVTTNLSPQPSKSSDFAKTVSFGRKCAACDKPGHMLSKCEKFLKMEPHQRFAVVKQAQLCFGCFASNHSSMNCNSVYKCRVCGSSSHNSLLHKSENRPSPSDPPPRNTAISGVMQSSLQSCSSILLGTAIVKVKDYMGAWIPIRCVIDAGSQISAVTEKLAQTLKLPRQRSAIQICGIGADTPIQSKGEIKCQVSPHSVADNESLWIHCVVLPKIAADLPSTIPSSVLQRFKHLKLADSSYLDKQLSTSIDMLIGAEHYAHLITSDVPVITGFPSAIPSKFGWLLMGAVRETSESSSHHQPKCSSLFVSSIEDPIATQLQRFWEMENVCDSTQRENPDDLACEQHFVKTHFRDKSGAYVVSLPFRDNLPPNLGTNQIFALNRLTSIKKRLDKDPKSKELYYENLNDYIQNGHMVPASVKSDYLLVHFGVRKESSTTKLRVVFDPNVKGSHQVSLAESLLVGPKLQNDIGDLLISFRLNAVALTCDVQAMYRSICVNESDRKYQHILWYDGDNPEIKEFEITRVLFGLPSSPYQAQRVLKQLVEDEGEKYPSAAPVVLDDIYVDDVVTGGQNVSDVINLRDQLIALLRAGGFNLRKFASSHPDVLRDLPQEVCELPHDLGSDESIKLLGMKWNPSTDVFFYTIMPPDSNNVTKRKILSSVASIYDLNGYLSPVTIWMKIFLQKLWLDKSVSWDSPLSPELNRQWVQFASELPLLSQVNIPRFILPSKSADLVGFADASNEAFGAVVYLRVNDQDQVTTHLLRAKTKVAPLKVHTINRLELCAALLLAKVINSLKFLSKRVDINNIYLFSDSVTVLSWLKTPPHQLKIYVANRVSQILELTEPDQWSHVTTERNSADPASRGLRPSQLVNNGLWFRGPSFLKSDPDSWPTQPVTLQAKNLPELKPTVLVTKAEENQLIVTVQKYSSLDKLKSVMAYVLRFIHNVKNPSDKRSNALSISELRESLLVCVRISQNFHLHEEMKAVKSGHKCPADLQHFSPIINSSGILAVGGRLAHAPIPDSAKHPILIPKKCHLATLLVRHFHALTLHGGPKIVQSLLQQQYWVIGAKNLIRSEISKCVPCSKMKPIFRQPMMADLPVSRYTQGRPFLNVGVDYAGPFTYKTGPRRNSPLSKCYFAIFVCMSTKCIHLELVSDLSTAAFLACLDRFVGRRGLPTCIFSDNGTNFRGAASYLADVQLFLQSAEAEISHYLQRKEIKWSFIPPSAPNFGGLWEAGVRSVKKHLAHVLNGQTWNFEMISTILISIEGILNSRPICGINSSPNDGVNYLTPGHFLIGAPLLARPEHDLSEEPMSHLQRWKLITHITQCFWKKWSKDYLNTLIQRPKWTQPSDGVKVGDVALIQGVNLPSQMWPVGVVTSISPGPDGVVRVVKLKTAKGEVTRPVSKVAILPLSSQ
uniref:Integrase catalytic domain-containing protein n=1 Tax=Cacopsylla melanoneura TaxID=428564 RepID=A0A8D8TAY9_9HEMI